MSENNSGRKQRVRKEETLTTPKKTKNVRLSKCKTHLQSPIADPVLCTPENKLIRTIKPPGAPRKRLNGARQLSDTPVAPRHMITMNTSPL